MPEAVPLAVRLPAPRFTVPAESARPPLRLIAPLATAVIDPWQFTKSAIDPPPPKPWVAERVRVVPAVWTRPEPLTLPKAVAAEPAGRSKSEPGPRFSVKLAVFCKVPAEKSRMELTAASVPVPAALKSPWLTRPPVET